MKQLEEKVADWVSKFSFITVTVEGKPSLNRLYDILMDDKTRAIAQELHKAQ